FASWCGWASGWCSSRRCAAGRWWLRRHPDDARGRTLGASVRVVRHTDVATFARLAVPLLGAAEAENNLPLGICAGLSSPASPPPYLATVEDVGGPVTVALMTPPRKLVLSAAPPEALEAICVDLIGHGTPV